MFIKIPTEYSSYCSKHVGLYILKNVSSTDVVGTNNYMASKLTPPTCYNNIGALKMSSQVAKPFSKIPN